MIFIRLLIGNLVQIVPFAFICFWPFENNLRYSGKKTRILTGALILICALIFSASGTYLSSILPTNHTLFQSVNLVFMLCLLPCLFWYIYAITSIWQKKLFIFSLTITCALAITSVANIISTFIYLDSPNDGLPYAGYTPIILLLASLCFLIPLRILYQKYFIPFEYALGARESSQLSILSIIMFLILSSWLAFMDYETLFIYPMQFYMYVMLLASIFIIYLLFFRMFASLEEKHVAEGRYLRVQYDMQLLDKQYIQLQESIENSRRLKHDLRHHMVTISELLNQNDTEEAKAYMQNYLHSMEEFELMKFCDHQIVNMIVSHYYSKCTEKNIQFNISIRLPKDMKISNSDLTVLLGNLLENAITAAGQAQPLKSQQAVNPTHNLPENRGVLENNSDDLPHINLNMILHRKMLAITVDNTYCGKLLSNALGEYLSTKENHSGLGIKSISSIARKYNGGVEFSHDHKEFHSYVMLGL